MDLALLEASLGFYWFGLRQFKGLLCLQEEQGDKARRAGLIVASCLFCLSFTSSPLIYEFSSFHMFLSLKEKNTTS